MSRATKRVAVKDVPVAAGLYRGGVRPDQLGVGPDLGLIRCP